MAILTLQKIKQQVVELSNMAMVVKYSLLRVMKQVVAEEQI